MYHCHIQFYLVGQGRGIFDRVRAVPPLDCFSHSFCVALEADPDLAAKADVILADLRGMDAPAAVRALLSGSRKEAF